MLATLAATLLLVALSAVLGQALCMASGWRPSWIAPAVGFAALLVGGGAVQYVPGHARTVAVAIAALCLASVARRSVRAALREEAPEALPIAVGVCLLAALPLFVSGRAGILGAGGQNDMVQHLTTAFWLQTDIGRPTVLVGQGYPLGPHGLVATLAEATGISLVQAFTALTLSIPALTALSALSALDGRPRVGRAIVAGTTGLCYLAASYLVQGAFKETGEALLLLAFVLGLRELRYGNHDAGWRHGIPLGILGAGTIYVYSYLGAAWPLAAAGLFAVFELAARPNARHELARAVLRVVPVAAGGLVVWAAIASAQAHRVLTFADSPFAHEPPAGKGNLTHAISAAQALGIWLRADFRFHPHPFGFTVVLLVIAGVTGCLALTWWIRRRDFALPAALVSAALIFWAATIHKNVYNQAKALAIAAPLVALAIGAATLAVWTSDGVPQRRRWPAAGIRSLAARCTAVVLLAGVAGSSFLALRDGPVEPGAHASELSPVAALVRGNQILDMDADDFTHWYLPGVDVATGPLLYPTRTVTPRPAKGWTKTKPLDFDSWSAGDLDQFRYVLEPRGTYRSATPPNFELARRTPSFLVWRRTGRTAPRRTIEPDGSPGAILDCKAPAGRRLATRGGVAGVLPAPIVRTWRAWNGSARFAGQTGRLAVRLPRGDWDISLQYMSNTGIRVRAPGANGGLQAILPPHLGRIGPYWRAGTVRHRGGALSVQVDARRLGLIGRLLQGAGWTRALDVEGNLPLQGIAFTRHGARERVVPMREACGRYVDWYRRGGA